ncbi:uncharacterized protein LOC132951339 [Metopolophium dirhodum]|uniref:uncharacterized protein LOC132951339 n=1 Tax=Metopolophium dirhodum TaxID=44670 RepID=UPI00298FD666|nr:uncharacterized protein LOC132951339 [Metopolophium dirhodum]
MSSTLFKSNVILLVLCIGMILFHNSSQMKEQGVLSKIKTKMPSLSCLSGSKKVKSNRAINTPTGGVTSNPHSHSQYNDNDNGHNEGVSDGGLGAVAAASYASSSNNHYGNDGSGYGEGGYGGGGYGGGGYGGGGYTGGGHGDGGGGHGAITD